MVKPVYLILLSFLTLSWLAVSGCGPKSEPQTASRHYPVSGQVTALNAKDQTATLDAAAIPNYMEAMTMAYPVQLKSEFEKLRVGESIKATINVYDSGDFNLSGIQEQPQNSR